MAMPTVIDLGGSLTGQIVVIQGDAAGDNAGWSVSSAGDINGDGYEDFIIGAPTGDNGGDRAGEAYILFGKPTAIGNVGGVTGLFDLTAITTADGFIIQ